MPKDNDADTEVSVAADVFGSDRDRGGNDAPPADDGTPKSRLASQDQPEAAPESASTEQPEKAKRYVPLDELTGERKKFQDRLDTMQRTFEDEIRKRDLQLAELRGAVRPPASQPQRPQIPDPVTDPDQYARHVHQTVEQRLFNQGLDFSERMARRDHGTAVVDEAFRAAEAQGLIQQGAFIQQNPHDPWGAMVEWHRRQKVLEKVGNDPDEYEKRIREDEKKRVLEELKKGSGNSQEFPGTLATATQAGAVGGHQSQSGVAKEIFGADRDRRRG